MKIHPQGRRPTNRANGTPSGAPGERAVSVDLLGRPGKPHSETLGSSEPALTRVGFAAKLGVAVRTLDAMAEDGRIPPPRLVISDGKREHKRWPAREIQAWLDHPDPRTGRLRTAAQWEVAWPKIRPTYLAPMHIAEMHVHHVGGGAS